MGMASSQARLLSITARINDIEFKSQSVANTKIRLADESEQVAKAYTDALNKSRLTYTSYADGQPQVIPLTLDSLSQYGYRLRKANGTDHGADHGIQDTDDVSSYDLYEMIESGQFFLEKDSNFNNTGVNANWNRTSVSGDNLLDIQSVDSVTLAKAEAEYNAASARINRKEKLLDNDMKALDTEHQALTTERDSVKNLIGEDVKSSFEIFS